MTNSFKQYMSVNGSHGEVCALFKTLSEVKLFSQLLIRLLWHRGECHTSKVTASIIETETAAWTNKSKMLLINHLCH